MGINCAYKLQLNERKLQTEMRKYTFNKQYISS